MTDRDLPPIQLALGTYFQNCLVRITNAGLLIAGVRPNATYEEARQRVLDLIEPHLERHNEFVYRLFIYSTVDEQFSVNGMLHTKASDSPDGIHTTYLNASDGEFLMKEIDFEFLSLMDKPDFPIEVRQSGTMFQLLNNKTYPEMSVMGMEFVSVTARNRDTRWYLEFDQNV